jgi:hypothetical protein
MICILGHKIDWDARITDRPCHVCEEPTCEESVFYSEWNDDEDNINIVKAIIRRQRFVKENNYRVKRHYCKNCDHHFTTKENRAHRDFVEYRCALMPEGYNCVLSDNECNKYSCELF